MLGKGREYDLNIPFNRSPKILWMPYNDKPSFKDASMRT